MKLKLFKNILIFIMLASLIFSLSSCAQNNIVQDDNKFNIVASFGPMYCLLLELTHGAENITLNNMTPSVTGCLHDYILLPKDLKLLEHCDMFVINGAGMEGFADSVFNNFNDIKIADSSLGINSISIQYASDIIETSSDIQSAEAACNDPSHDHDEHNDHAGKNHHDHDHELNPHFWLSLNLVQLQAKNIVSELCKLNPQNAEIYTKNLAEFCNSAESLIYYQQDVLKGSPLKENFSLSLYPTFDYFLLDAGTKPISVVADSEDTPTAYYLSKLITYINDTDDISCIFGESQFSSTFVKTISNETGLPLITLDSLVNADYEKGSYFKTMRSNIDLLASLS
jgi:ABC-type metal ion transport system, periplasmic component/surface adhesin